MLGLLKHPSKKWSMRFSTPSHPKLTYLFKQTLKIVLQTKQKNMEHIGKTFLSLHSELKKLHSNHVFIQYFVNKGSKNFNLRINEIQDNLGDKPTKLNDMFDAPSLWGATGALGNSWSHKIQIDVHGQECNCFQSFPQFKFKYTLNCFVV